MKKFILGFLVGSLLFATIPVHAAIQEYVAHKADYRVVVNGKEYDNPDLPILNYKGNTYAPFRSILEAAGLSVNWNNELRQAEVTNKESEAGNMNTIEKDGYKLLVENGIEYIAIVDIALKYDGKGYYFPYDKDTQKTSLAFNGQKLLDITISKISGSKAYIEYAYYKNTILPLIN